MGTFSSKWIPLYSFSLIFHIWPYPLSRSATKETESQQESRDYQQLPTERVFPVSLLLGILEDAILIYLRGNKVILDCIIYPNNQHGFPIFSVRVVILERHTTDFVLKVEVVFLCLLSTAMSFLGYAGDRNNSGHCAAAAISLHPSSLPRWHYIFLNDMVTKCYGLCWKG